MSHASLTPRCFTHPARLNLVARARRAGRPRRPSRALPTNASAVMLQPGFEESIAIGDLDQPMAIQFSQDGRVFVAEKSGIIKVFDGLGDETPTVFADLRTRGPQLLGPRVHEHGAAPELPGARPYMYVYYVRDAAIGGTAPRWGAAGVTSDSCPNPPGGTVDGCVVSGRLSRLTAVGNTMTAEHVLIDDWCQQYPSHAGGGLGFGADGYLYFSGGDGAAWHFNDYGQDGDPVNPCGDPPGGVGVMQTVPDRRRRPAALAGPAHARRPGRPERLADPHRPDDGRGGARATRSPATRTPTRAASSATACATRSAWRSGPARATSSWPTSAAAGGRRSTA